ncbi:MAG: hypothetical protein R2741_05815 [Methanolobus sp.]
MFYLDELAFPQISENSFNRCYYCKKEIIGLLNSVKDELGFSVIIEGSNASDSSSYRPGKRAIEEAGDTVYSPFIEFDVTKDDIRAIAKEMGLSVATKSPSPCLASRFPMVMFSLGKRSGDWKGQKISFWTGDLKVSG